MADISCEGEMIVTSIDYLKTTCYQSTGKEQICLDYTMGLLRQSYRKCERVVKCVINGEEYRYSRGSYKISKLLRDNSNLPEYVYNKSKAIVYNATTKKIHGLGSDVLIKDSEIQHDKLLKILNKIYTVCFPDELDLESDFVLSEIRKATDNNNKLSKQVELYNKQLTNKYRNILKDNFERIGIRCNITGTEVFEISNLDPFEQDKNIILYRFIQLHKLNDITCCKLKYAYTYICKKHNKDMESVIIAIDTNCNTHVIVSKLSAKDVNTQINVFNVKDIVSNTQELRLYHNFSSAKTYKLEEVPKQYIAIVVAILSFMRPNLDDSLYGYKFANIYLANYGYTNVMYYSNDIRENM